MVRGRGGKRAETRIGTAVAQAVRLHVAGDVREGAATWQGEADVEQWVVVGGGVRHGAQARERSDLLEKWEQVGRGVPLGYVLRAREDGVA